MTDELLAQIIEAKMTGNKITLVCGCTLAFFTARDPSAKNLIDEWWALSRAIKCNRATKHPNTSGGMKDPRLSHLLRKDAFLRKKYAEKRAASS